MRKNCWLHRIHPSKRKGLFSVFHRPRKNPRFRSYWYSNAYKKELFSDVFTMYWCWWQTWDFRDMLEYVTFLSKTFVINIIVVPESEPSWTWKSDLTKFWVGKNDRHPTGSDRYGSCGYRTVSPSPFLFVSKQILLDQKRIQPYSKSLPWTKFKRKFTRKFAFRTGSKKIWPFR